MISELPGSLNFAINTNIIALLIIHNIRNLFNKFNSFISSLPTPDRIGHYYTSIANS